MTENVTTASASLSSFLPVVTPDMARSCSPDVTCMADTFTLSAPMPAANAGMVFVMARFAAVPVACLITVRNMLSWLNWVFSIF